MQAPHVQEQLVKIVVDPACPTDEEKHEAKTHTKDEYLWVLMVHCSDPKQYISLIPELQNNHTHRSDQYPTTLNKAYDMIINTEACNNPHS